MPQDEIALFKAWVEGGTPEGMPNDEKSEEDAPPVETMLRAPDIVGKSKEPYLPDATRPDDYRCFALDAEFPETRSLREHVLFGRSIGSPCSRLCGRARRCAFVGTEMLKRTAPVIPALAVPELDKISVNWPDGHPVAFPMSVKMVLPAIFQPVVALSPVHYNTGNDPFSMIPLWKCTRSMTARESLDHCRNLTLNRHSGR